MTPPGRPNLVVHPSALADGGVLEVLAARVLEGRELPVPIATLVSPCRGLDIEGISVRRDELKHTQHVSALGNEIRFAGVEAQGASASGMAWVDMEGDQGGNRVGRRRFRLGSRVSTRSVCVLDALGGRG